MIQISTWEVPIYLFYSPREDADGEERIRSEAETRRDAQLAACMLDWLEYNLLPADYQIITRPMRHSEREFTWEALNQWVAFNYGDTDPYVCWVTIGFDHADARILFQDAFRNVE